MPLERPELDSDEWRDLEALEARYLESSKRHLAKHRGTCEKCQFLGFAYRGVVTHGGREQTFQLSPGVGGELVPTKVERLIKVYLSTYGKATTFNNLILETLWAGLQEAQDRGVALHLGSPNSVIETDRQGFTSIELSSALLERLGSGEAIWSQVGELADSGAPEESLFPICQSLLAPTRYKVGEAALYVLSEESEFAWDLVDLIGGAQTAASQAVAVLETWLGAFQGLLLLKPIVGSYWLTVPVRPRFQLPKHTRLPLSALTVATNSGPPDVTHVLATARALEVDEVASAIAESIMRRQNQDDEKFRDALRKVFLEGEECSIEWRHMRELPSLLSLSQKLVGKKHEGKPLNFTLLCAPDSHLLKLHRGSHHWTLSEIHSFPQVDLLATINGVAREMESNAFILQDPGRALFFRPHSLWPSAVVQFRPFDSQQRNEYLREFTKPPGEAEPPAIAIQITPETAFLFAAGRLVAALQKYEWKPVVTDLQAPGGYALLLQAIKALGWWSTLDPTEQENFENTLKIIARATVEVSKKGYGALFFLVKEWLPEGGRPRVTTMAPVWAKQRAIQHDDPSFIAAFAGLDGETYIELKSGYYRTRQFAVVPSAVESFLETFNSEGAKTPAFEEYLISYSEYLAGEGLGGKLEEHLEEVAQFGTRHMKALRITRAYPESTIAITVSSNGPVRIWDRGFSKVL